MKTAPLSELQRYRSYSRRKESGQRETWDETVDRVLYSPDLGLQKLGEFTTEEIDLIDNYLREKIAFGSARWLWVGGTEWISKPENYPGAFNCTGFHVHDLNSFKILMDLGMMGCGTGAVIENYCINQLPEVSRFLDVEIVGNFGDKPSQPQTSFSRNLDPSHYSLIVGDSRKGWCDAYYLLLSWATMGKKEETLNISIDISHVRQKGQPLKGFGGIANPNQLPQMFVNVARILNGAIGRQLNSLEVCLLIGEAASCYVAGNVRRSAGIRQGSADDDIFATSKDNLWKVDDAGTWKIDPERDSLRTANHTRVFYHKPSLEECIESVRKQFFSGEGAIQYAPEAIARANFDLLENPIKKKIFLECCSENFQNGLDYLMNLGANGKDILHRMQRYSLNPCGEIIGHDFFCNLSSVHLNQIDPLDIETQRNAFKASALQAAAFLKRGFIEERYQKSRELDPIVGVSFTGAFTFFVNAFGIDWLHWWQKGRPQEWKGCRDRVLTINKAMSNDDSDGMSLGDLYRNAEIKYLNLWRQTVENTVWNYCDRHSLKRPNRCTTLKPEGSQTLLTGVGACGWHPPKATHYIRRMTFGAYDPIALAAIDYGYTAVPSQSCKDEQGNLLKDPFDSRVTEWLIEVPVREPWADIEGAEKIDPSSFPIEAQWDFSQLMQMHYVRHNTSSTLEIYEEEIETLGRLIYEDIQENRGYVSAAILGRSKGNSSFPMLPFEPISKETYERRSQEVLVRRKSDDFAELLAIHDNQNMSISPQDSACDSGACAIK